MPRRTRSGRYRKYNLGTSIVKPLYIPKPSSVDLRRLEIHQHVWSVGDRYSKLAALHYGDSKLWWVIAKYNMKPTDAHVKLGDNIYIPMPLTEILKIYRV